jgi:multidrug resistance efflux pump
LDIPRAPVKNRRRYVYIGGAIAALVIVTVALSRLEPAAPSVDRATLWIDSVRRGTMLRQVRAPGTLVPEQIRWVSAVTAGRVEKLNVRPGMPVTTSTVLLELSNPDVQLEALTAQQQLAAAEAQLVSLKSQLETQRLNQEGVVAQIRTQYNDALRQAAVTQKLDSQGMTTAIEAGRTKDLAVELRDRLRVEQERLKIMTAQVQSQLDLQKRQVERMRGIAQFQQDRVASMRVLAGADGLLQELPLELGQWVTPGFILAKVYQPGRLKAVLRVPETQAKDVVIGQSVAVDTRNGIVSGHVMRIDPASQNGTVGVEVSLDGELPKGARPDLSVDGTIEIERLTNVLYVGRPAYGQSENVIGLFKVEPDGKTAVRTQVKLGRASVNTIEVMQGLAVGDSVIISDMSAYDNVDKVRIKR